jgi:hypothetical protein
MFTTQAFIAPAARLSAGKASSSPRSRTAMQMQISSSGLWYVYCRRKQSKRQKHRGAARTTIRDDVMVVSRPLPPFSPCTPFTTPPRTQLNSTDQSILTPPRATRYPDMRWDARGLRMAPDQEPEVRMKKEELAEP